MFIIIPTIINPEHVQFAHKAIYKLLVDFMTNFMIKRKRISIHLKEPNNFHTEIS